MPSWRQLKELEDEPAPNDEKGEPDSLSMLQTKMPPLDAGVDKDLNAFNATKDSTLHTAPPEDPLQKAAMLTPKTPCVHQLTG